MIDLVERLRNAKYVMFFDGWTSNILAIEAADEIERLRALSSRTSAGDVVLRATRSDLAGRCAGNDAHRSRRVSHDRGEGSGPSLRLPSLLRHQATELIFAMAVFFGLGFQIGATF